MHNLTTIQSRIAMMYVGSAPWHKLGTRLAECRNVEQGLRAASMYGWDVRAEPLYLADGRMVDGRRAIVRGLDGGILGTAGDRYHILQNEESFGLLQTACDEYGVTIETAGALGTGSVVWMLAKLPDANGTIVPGDTVKPYFLIASSHDGTRALTATNTPIRVVCQNTLNMVGKADLSIRHTASAESRLAEVKRMVETLASRFHQTCETYRQLADVAVSLDDVVAYTERVFPVAAKVDAESRAMVAELLGTKADKAARESKADEARAMVVELLQTGTGSELAGRTAWGAYNAVTEYIDHVSVSTKAGKPRVGGFESAVFGTGAGVKERALEAAVDMWLPSAASRN